MNRLDEILECVANADRVSGTDPHKWQRARAYAVVGALQLADPAPASTTEDADDWACRLAEAAYLEGLADGRAIGDADN